MDEALEYLHCISMVEVIFEVGSEVFEFEFSIKM